MKAFQLIPAVYREELNYYSSQDEEVEDEEIIYEADYESLVFRNLYIDLRRVESFMAQNESYTVVTMESGVQYLVSVDEGTFRTLCEDFANINIRD